MSPAIVVVGSANLDIVVPVPHHPARGETVLGGDHQQVPGGKGANQAVAAARLGGDVAFVGCVGDDAMAETLRRSLTNADVSIDALHTMSDAPTGIALITVGPDGDNAIVVSPGANSTLRPEHVRAEPSVRAAAVVQLQLEIPLDTVREAAEIAAGFVILDPAPAPTSGLSAELLAAVDLLIPNETELALLAGRVVDATSVDDVAEAARAIPVPAVIVTLGSNGAVVVTDEEAVHVPAPAITAVDTTGAGDAFRSAIAVSIASGVDLVPAAHTAVRVGAATALRFGAQPSLPTRDEVEQLLQ